MSQPATKIPKKLNSQRLDVDIAHPAVPVDAPTVYSIIVITRLTTPDLRERPSRWLPIACFIHTSALQDGLLSLPSPRKSKSRVALRHHRLLQLSLLPCASSVHADLDPGNPSSSTPRQSAYFLEARLDLPAPAGTGDNGFGFHDKTELIRFAVGHEVRVLRGFPPGHERGGPHFKPTQPFHVNVAFKAGQQQT